MTTNDLFGITCGTNQFVAVGDAGTILGSPDGATWTLRDSGVTNNLTAVAYGNGQFVVVGGPFTIAAVVSSPDGVTWTRRNTGENSGLSGITYAAGRFVAVGDWGKILSSPDGSSWTPHLSGTAIHLRGIACGNGRLVAVGLNGTLLESGEVVELGTTFSQDGVRQVTVSGAAGRNYGIEVSTDLSNWLPLSHVVTGADGTTQLPNPAATNISPRFYRAVLP
ncbi:MAG: WD40/YVTN/BNR-like repeat-containing protein [Limisphaerales bacterium]